ncbi:FliM/FliN family flagellar motor C-terminal domain-containing protein [Roseovarius spongiae]|nr:FliM/FliN family flagellar motor C-terminal domain-containing protein [Roseovarius spongiae]
MTDDGPKSVMQRIARNGREEYEARAMSPVNALRLSLARAADRLFDLALSVSTVEQVEITYGGLSQALPGAGLLALLDGPGGAAGAMHVDAGLLAALIETQTVGRVSGRRDEARIVTRTDAAIAAPFIDGALERVDAGMEAEEAGDWTSGYRFGAMMEDARSLILALHAAEFTCFNVMLEIGEGAYPGALTLLLPLARPAPRAAAPTDGARDAGRARQLGDAVAAAPIALRAVLARIRLPLDRACGLSAGDVLPLPAGRLDDIRLEASHRHLVATGSLGQMSGACAVRVTSLGLPEQDDAAPPDAPAGGLAPKQAAPPTPSAKDPPPASRPVPKQEKEPEQPTALAAFGEG